MVEGPRVEGLIFGGLDTTLFVDLEHLLRL